MLTLKQLKDMPEGKVFPTGVTVDSPEGINLTRSGRKVRWIAKRGGIHDWCIYVHWAESDINYIKAHGDKVHDENNIKKLVECDDEAFEMYRQ